jgi:Tfp pilus assembly protein PilX
MERLRRDERGSTLVIALAFVAVFSLWLSSLLPFSSTGLRLSKTVEDQRNVVYAADAAIEAAINALRPSNGAACATPMAATPLVNGLNATVACAGGASGSGPPVNVNNRPGQALLTLSRSVAEVGIAKSVGSTNLKVHGGVFSNSNIAASGTITVEKGDIKARTGCSGISLAPTTTTTTPTYTSNCTLGTTIDPTGDDPKFVSPVAWRPAVDTPPPAPLVRPCTNMVKVEPGTYNDVNVLNAWTNENPCRGSLIWFSPGAYYFNFTNAGSHIWTVADPGNSGLVVVAGTPKGWNALGGPSVRPAVPAPGGSCMTAADYLITPANPEYPANVGVQFIFGGDSQLHVAGGTMEICAQPSTAKQQIALYGLSDLATLYPAPLPPFTAQSGCVSTPAGCPMLRTGPGNNSVLVVQGTVYTPAAFLDLNMPNNSISKFFGRGIIARALAISIPGSQDGNTAIEVPDFSPGTISGYPFQEVLLTATIGGVPRLRARVHFENTPPLATATILDWSVLR